MWLQWMHCRKRMAWRIDLKLFTIMHEWTCLRPRFARVIWLKAVEERKKLDTFWIYLVWNKTSYNKKKYPKEIIKAKAAVTHNEINESIATVRKKRAWLFHWIGHTALKRFSELQSHCAKNGSDRFSCNDQSHCNETCKAFDCKVIETRPQVSYFYYLQASKHYSYWRSFLKN